MHCALARNTSSPSSSDETEEHRAKTYHSLVLREKLQTAVRWIRGRENGGVLLLEEKYTKMGERVMEVLRAKNPDALPPSTASLDNYPVNPLEMVPVNITDNVVVAVAGRLSREAGPRGTDLVSIQHWILRFGAASGELRLIVAEFG